MRLVSDAGPLIALAQIEQLDLLASFFDEVLIPLAVESEILAKAGPETRLLRGALGSWIRAVEHRPAADLESRLGELDRGERAAIRLRPAGPGGGVAGGTVGGGVIPLGAPQGARAPDRSHGDRHGAQERQIGFMAIATERNRARSA